MKHNSNLAAGELVFKEDAVSRPARQQPAPTRKVLPLQDRTAFEKRFFPMLHQNKRTKAKTGRKLAASKPPKGKILDCSDSESEDIDPVLPRQRQHVPSEEDDEEAAPIMADHPKKNKAATFLGTKKQAVSHEEQEDEGTVSEEEEDISSSSSEEDEEESEFIPSQLKRSIPDSDSEESFEPSAKTTKPSKKPNKKVPSNQQQKLKQLEELFFQQEEDDPPRQKQKPAAKKKAPSPVKLPKAVISPDGVTAIPYEHLSSREREELKLRYEAKQQAGAGTKKQSAAQKKGSVLPTSMDIMFGPGVVKDPTANRELIEIQEHGINVLRDSGVLGRIEYIDLDEASGSEARDPQGLVIDFMGVLLGTEMAVLPGCCALVKKLGDTLLVESIFDNVVLAKALKGSGGGVQPDDDDGGNSGLFDSGSLSDYDTDDDSTEAAAKKKKKNKKTAAAGGKKKAGAGSSRKVATKASTKKKATGVKRKAPAASRSKKKAKTKK